MTGSYLLDTSIIIPFLNGDQALRAVFGQTQEIAISAIAAGELYFGAERSSRPHANRAVVARFLGDQCVLPCDDSVAREYGRLKGVLKKRGTPIPENDIWIAATAIHHNPILASRDRHFGEIEGLQTVSW